MAYELGWTLGYSSSLYIAIVSTLFLVVCITLYTLCTTCFRKTPDCSEKREMPSSLPSTEKPETQLSRHNSMANVLDLRSMTQKNVPAVSTMRKHYRSHTMMYGQGTNAYSHNRAESHGYFSERLMCQLPDTPAFSLVSANSIFPGVSDLTTLPHPTTFHLHRLRMEPTIMAASERQSETVLRDYVSLQHKCQADTNNQSSDHIYVLPDPVSEEHPYACIDSASGALPPFPCDAAAENQWESESSYQSVMERKDPAACLLDTAFAVTDSGKVEVPEHMSPSLPAEHNVGCLIVSEQCAIYAEVKKKKNREFPVSLTAVVLDEVVAAPPIPEKVFV